MLLFGHVLFIFLTWQHGTCEKVSDAGRSNRNNVKSENQLDNEDINRSDKTVSLNDDPALWPGHLEFFGSAGPIHSIDVHSKYPDPLDFLNNYAAPYVPVHCKAAEKGSFPTKNWKNVSYFMRLPQSATNFVKLSNQTSDVSFRKYVSELADSGIVFENETPHFLRDDVPFPKCLLCDAILQSMSRDRLWISHVDHSSIIQRRNTDTLQCVYVGRQEFTLISHIEYGDKIPSDYKDIDVKRVDFIKYPTLREVGYLRVRARAGDCVFIPAKWYWQVKSIGKTYAIDIEWYHRTKGVKQSDCKLLKEISNLQSVSFKDGVIATSKPDVILHYFSSYLTTTSNFTSVHFRDTIRKDQKLMEDMVEWNDEFETITDEIFSILDINTDGLFSLLDLESLNPEILEDTRGLLEDRLQDFEDIMKDQQEEAKAATENAPKPPATNSMDIDAEKVMQDYLKDYISNLQDVIHESIDEMSVTGKLPDIKQKFAEKQARGSKDKPKVLPNESKPKQKREETEREKAKARIKINQEKKKLKDQKEEELRKKKSNEESFVIVDDSLEEEILADDDEEETKHQSSKKIKTTQKPKKTDKGNKPRMNDEL